MLFLHIQARPQQHSPLVLPPVGPVCTTRSEGATQCKRPGFLSHLLEEKKPKLHQDVTRGTSKGILPKPQPLRTGGCLLQHFWLNTWTNTCTLKGNVIALSISGKPVFFNMYSNKYLTFKKCLLIHHLKSHLQGKNLQNVEESIYEVKLGKEKSYSFKWASISFIKSHF